MEAAQHSMKGVNPMDTESLLKEAAEAVSQAEALVITAGAGMGVDSGLPDFRGDEGFWNAYPPYRHLGVSFIEMANPAWFYRDPSFAWGFYGHRRNLYRSTSPHRGFECLLRWGESKPGKYFVFTSNVDSQFQKAGFSSERIDECHGSIEWNQCTGDCGIGVFKADEETLEVDAVTLRAKGDLPSCPKCRELARPNILMFGDFGWDSKREYAQNLQLYKWLEEIKSLKIVIVECGAGSAIPTVRHFGEGVAREFESAVLIRINPRDPEVPSGNIRIPLGSGEALSAIDRLMNGETRA